MAQVPGIKYIQIHGIRILPGFAITLKTGTVLGSETTTMGRILES
jgi:hypothetical protein